MEHSKFNETKAGRIYADFKNKYPSNFPLKNTKWWKITYSAFLTCEFFKETLLFSSSDICNIYSEGNKYLININPKNEAQFEKAMNFSMSKNERKLPLHKSKDISTVHDLIRVAIVFGVVEAKFLKNYKFTTYQNLIHDLAFGMETLKFSNEFLQAKNVKDFFVKNWRSIFENQKDILLNYPKEIATDVVKIMFSHFLYLQNQKNVFNNAEAPSVFLTFMQKGNTDNWQNEALKQRMSTALLEPIFNTNYALTSEEEDELIEDKLVGYIGECIFNYYASSKSRFLSKANQYIDEFKNINFNIKDIWTSSKEPYSPFDFEIDGRFFEVKTSKKLIEEKVSFHLSEFELDHMIDNIDNSYICRISNVDFNLFSDSEDKENDPFFVKMAQDSIFTFIKYKDLVDSEKYNLKPKGYFVNEK